MNGSFAGAAGGRAAEIPDTVASAALGGATTLLTGCAAKIFTGGRGASAVLIAVPAGMAAAAAGMTAGLLGVVAMTGSFRFGPAGTAGMVGPGPRALDSGTRAEVSVLPCVVAAG
ncbi:MAG: hypothetical protein O3B27_00965, partial [Actinomycetota bacterium]|nr:hypothetical protein [Actinomycetota bacterium]